MRERLLNLQLLLNVSAFARWPLSIVFFAKDVYEKWHGKDVKPQRQLPTDFSAELGRGADDATEQQPITQDMHVARKLELLEERPSMKALRSLDLDYTAMKPQLERSIRTVGGGRSISCSVCSKELQMPSVMPLVCPNASCGATTHLACMAERFLAQDGGMHAVVPAIGSCPSCNARHEWADLVRDLSLRLRGQAEVDKLFKEPRKRKAKDGKIQVDEGQTEASIAAASIVDRTGQAMEQDEEETDAEYDASFAEEVDANDDSDAESERPLPDYPLLEGRKSAKSPKKLAAIPDSEWGDIDEIT